MIFLQGAFVYGEPLGPVRIAAFACIWAGLAVYVADIVRLSRRRALAQAATPRQTSARMATIVIRGGRRLKGRIPLSGPKTAALTLRPCAPLYDEPLTFRNLPRLAAVHTTRHPL